MSIPTIAPYSLSDANAHCKNTVEWTLNPEKAVLLVHDMQAYFTQFYDSSNEPLTTVLANIRRILRCARAQNVPVVYTAQAPDQSPEDRALLRDFWGDGLKTAHDAHHILAAIAPTAEEKIYTKWRYSAFQKSSLDDDLRKAQKSQIVIVGVYAHIGILSTALDGFMRDYQCFVVNDAVADFSAEKHLSAQHWIAQCCGMLLNSQSLIEQLASPPDCSVAGAHPGLDMDIQQWLSDLLETPLDTIKPTDNLADWGMDSMRLMRIVDTLKQRGIELDFIQLAQTPTLAAWQDVFARHRAPRDTTTRQSINPLTTPQQQNDNKITTQ